MKHLPLLFFVVWISACQVSSKSATVHLSESTDPLVRLMEGNKRFIENHPIHPDQSLTYLRELEKGQHPFAIVVGCSDSRVPPELVFDQGFGDLFVIRTAGNVIGDYELGSIEYAAEHLHTPLLVVLGHEGCGAISAYVEHQNDRVPGHIQHLIDYIKAEPEEIALDNKDPDFLRKAILANIEHGVHLLRDSESIMKELVTNNKINIVGGLYNMDNGKVELLDIK
jgi:carbonic anhydrase